MSNKRFTPREREVIQALLAGATDHKKLCAVLCVEESTVNRHLCNLRAKTGTENMAALVLWFCRHGFLYGFY